MRRLILLFLLICPAFADAAVWEDIYQWDARWEKEYSEWVRTKWTPDIFTNPQSPYYEIATDCADASYAMAIIFAYEHKLPFVMRDPSHHSSRNVISNRMNRWQGTPLTKLRKFIDYVADMGSTRTLPYDTYPVAINRHSFVAGLILVEPGEHSMQVAELERVGIPRILNSTVPKKVRPLEEFVNYPVYVPDDHGSYKDGYRHFRRTENELFSSVQNVPGFSAEQYEIARRAGYDHNNFSEAMASRLAIVPETMDQKALRLISNLCYYANERIRTVDGAWGYYLEIGQRCMNSSEYYDHSTPSRDQRIRDMFENLQRLSHTHEYQSNNAVIIDYVDAILYPEDPISPQFARELTEFCPLNYRRGQTISLREFWRRMQDGLVSSNPHAPVGQRWGEGPTPYTPQCPTY